MFSEEVELYIEDFKDKLEKVLDGLNNEYGQIKAGRANPRILDRVLVDYYGQKTPLNQMSTISIADARMLTVSLWDISQMKNVTKAIQEANLGLTPSDDGRVIRLVFPALTEDRRRELSKDVSRITENFKVTCRNERRDVLDVFKKMKKDGEISEDEYTGIEKTVQNILDKYMDEIEKMETAKVKDIMEL